MENATPTTPGAPATLNEPVDVKGDDESTETPNTFHRFSDLPVEVRLDIWELALPGPRIVHLKMKPLKVDPFIRAGHVSSNWPITPETPLEFSESEIPSKLDNFEAEREELKRASVVNMEPNTSTFDEFYIAHPESINLSNLSGFYSDVPPPTILYVCHEAYEVVSKFYTKAFSAHCALPTTWFDFKRDTLLLAPDDDKTFCLNYDPYNNFVEEFLARLHKNERLLVENVAVNLKGEQVFRTDTYSWLVWTMIVFRNIKNLTYELPRTAKEPGPWMSVKGEMEEYRRDEFQKGFECYLGNESKEKIEDYKGEGWNMPKIVEKCISEL